LHNSVVGNKTNRTEQNFYFFFSI